MKKKIFYSFLIVSLLFMTVGCSKKNEASGINEKQDVINKPVVIYFSATGTTKNIATRIADKLASDIIEIVPKVKYTSADLNYNSDCRANREQNDSSARPEIENEINIDEYDTIYLGYPIWWGTNPKIILTLLDTYDFTGKTIIPFCTSGSSGIEDSVDNLRKYNSNLNIKDGKRFSSDDSDEDINIFVNSN